MSFFDYGISREWKKKSRDSNLRHPAPKRILVDTLCLFPGISAPFRSKTRPFRHSCLHCFRVLRAQ